MEELVPHIKVIDPWREDTLPDGYVIRFGNASFGWLVDPKHLKEVWNIAIRKSAGGTTHPGDVALLYNKKTVRSLWNANKRLLDKEIEYPCIYTKHTNHGLDRN